MKTDIYVHHGEHLCAIVSSDEGYKFVDYIESFCPDWHFLIDEAKTGFASFPFYDRYKNYDVAFWDQYMDINDGNDDNYAFIGSVCDGVINIDSENLIGKGKYFETLLTAITISETYDFNCIQDIVFTEKYIVLSSDQEVLACSKIKIPFEPNMDQKTFRNLIRSKLNSLKPLENQVLHAKYGCSTHEFVDVENALFYNIGTKYFGAALYKDAFLYFQRIQPNELYHCDNYNYQYFYHYALVPKTKYTHWWEHEIVCEWNNVPLKKINTTSTAADYYLAIKRSPKFVKCFTHANEATLGLKIRLFIPKTSNFTNIVSVMKPIIDGVLCAFYIPNEIAVDEICKRLNVEKDMFSSTKTACLGKRCYISPYRNSVKWNPQDEKLDYVIFETISVDDNTFSFSGQIFAIPCYM